MQSVNLSVRKESASDRARQKRRGEEAPGRAVERFADGLPTLASLRRGCGRPAPRLRLCGGGESSLGNATGWGSPPSSSNGNAGSWGNVGQGGSGNGPNPPQQWGNNLQRPPVSQADVNSNKSLGSQNSIPSSSGASGVSPGTPASPNAGWQSQTPPQNNSNLPLNGSSNSTQGGGAGGGAGGDGSPGGNASGNGSPGGNASSNGSLAPNSAKNQLEQLSSMRETLFSQDGWGGQHVNQDTDWDVPGSPEPGVKPDQPGAPPLWKPNVNNGTDLWEANLRNGGQPPPPQTPKTPWGHTPATNIGGTWGEDDEPADAANVWNGPPPPQHQWGGAPPQPHPHSHWPKKDDWGAWGEAERDPRRLDPRAPDPHERDPRDPRFARPPDPRDLKDPRDLRGDPRGISGRLNGAPAGDAWPHRAPPPAKLPHGKPGGWEEPSPPAQRRAPPFDEGGWQRGPQRPPHAPPGRPPGPLKPEAPWPHAPRNGSWDEGPAPAAHGWDKEGAAWAEAGWGAPPKPKPWDAEAPGDWAKPGPPAKLLPKDAVWNSKQFQLLVGMGYKKEEAEEALRSRNMNAEEAAELLSQMRGGGAMDAWRRHDDHAPFERPQYPPQRPHHFQPPAGPYQSGAAPAPHKMLGQPAAQPPPPSPFAQPNSQSGAQPCTSQLRQLVQQIQMAVSNGYLNHQILNQPLAPPTLVLLNQLLQQIKSLHQLVQQQNMVQNSLGNGKSNSTAVLHISVQITKTKQQIQNLQNQITAQQALYLKQQGGAGGSSASDFFKQPHDPLQQLQNNFADIGLGKEPQTGYGGGGGGQQSRLNQWKLPAPDKEAEEFSRAPGSVAKSAASPPGPGGDAWGGGRPHGEAAWGGEADAPDGKEAPAWPSAAQAAYSDLVPEFEPGKPWKMKMVEDDPAITPGSVAVRSPLGLGAGKEEGEAAPAPERSLSSSTWSYAPFKPKGWEGEWGKRGPGGPGPPKPWHGAPPTAQRPHHQQPQPPPAAWHSSTWLLLKNLTAQIDGSTLKTLCMQHGPLQSFHLYLTQGIALARYSTREEANKAQTALNNCVLGNTTIFAEAPGDSDVSMILQHLGQGGGGGWRREGRDGRDGREPGPKPPLGPDQPWPFGSLWADEQRATPSSLNSFLPPDLLGGESV